MKAIRTRPLAIVAAINGAEYSPRQYPSIPVTAEEAIREAVEVTELGAGYVHFHAREPRSGDQFVDPAWFAQVREGLTERAPEVAISFASSRKGLVAGQIQSSVATARLVHPNLSMEQLVELELQRAVGMDSKPDLMTIFTALETKMNSRDEEDSQAAIGSYQGTATRGFTDPSLITAYYHKVYGLYETRQIVPEYEITTMGALWTIEMLARKKWLPERPHFLFLFGFSARLPISRPVFDLSMAFVRYLRSEYGIQPVVTAGSVIQPQRAAARVRRIDEAIEPGKHDYLELLDWVLAEDTVDAIRVGLEDTPVHFGRNARNAELVSLIRSECETANVKVLRDPALVHGLFGIRGRAN